MSAAGEFTYTGYAYQTVRTLRGLLDSTPVSPSRWSIGTLGYNTLGPSGRASTRVGQPEVEIPSAVACDGGGGLTRTKRSLRAPLNELFQDLSTKQDSESSGRSGGHVDQASLPDPSTATAPHASIESPSTRALDKVLYFAGTHEDPYNTSQDGSLERIPLLALCPSGLPPEMTELTVAQLTARLDDYGRDPYMLVLFASPSAPIPVQSLIRYYRGVRADTRRNVRRIWICHAGLFTRIAVKIFLNTIVSGKVTRKGKLKLVNSLSSLALDIDITSFPISPDVLAYDKKVEKTITIPASLLKPKVYAKALSEAMTRESLPRPVNDALRFLRENDNLDTHGLFRKAPRKTSLDLLCDTYESGLTIRLEDWPEGAILAASSIKRYLRHLPCPIFPRSAYAPIKACPVDQEASLAYIKEQILPKLAEDHPDGDLAVILFREVMSIAADVSRRQDINQMDSYNLAVVFLPLLVRSADVREDAEMCRMPAKKYMQAERGRQACFGQILMDTIEHFDVVFGSGPTPGITVL